MSVSELQEKEMGTPRLARYAEENLMRSRIIWTTVPSGVMLIGIGLMHFSLTALQQPGPLETRIANLAKHSAIHLASRHGIPPQPLDAKATIEGGGAHYGLDCAEDDVPGEYLSPD